MKQPPIKSTHIDDTVQAIARLRADHDQKATPLEWTVARLTGRAASPRFVVLLSLVLVSWVGLNTILLLIGRRPLDEPPFFWMQGAVSLAALYMTVLILATQRRENESIFAPARRTATRALSSRRFGAPWPRLSPRCYRRPRLQTMPANW